MERRHQSWLQTICSWLNLSSSEVTSEIVLDAIDRVPLSDLENLLDVLVSNFDQLSDHPPRLRILMQAVATRVVGNPGNDPCGPSRLSADSVPTIEPLTLSALYDRLSEVERSAAAHILQTLAVQPDDESIATLARILSDSPPLDWQLVGLALSPLWNAEPERVERFFSSLEDDFTNPSTITVLLDLAGYAVRKGKLPEHPWAERSEQLSSLLSKVVLRLHQLEADPSKFGADVATVQKVLSESIALTVALCDALGLIGEPNTESSLLETLKLSHRRIHTEAAGALARMGNAAGKQRLIELASDPIVRSRAVYYADELGFLEEIDESLSHPQSLAESELAQWLADSDQFGFPPTEIELVDARSMYWPSFEEPRACYLFRYTYRLQQGTVSNIGIAGPLTYAFNADLANLPVDDIYAAFAGWQAEHDDIFEVPSALLNSSQQREAERLSEYLTQQGLEGPEPIALTFFLGEVALLTAGIWQGNRHCAITDGIEMLTFPVSTSPTSFSPELVLAIFRGRKLMRTFNS